MTHNWNEENREKGTKKKKTTATKVAPMRGQTN